MRRSETTRAKENQAGVASAKRLFDCWLPWMAGNHVPTLHPAENTAFFEPDGDSLNRSFVHNIVRQKRTKALIGRTCASCHVLDTDSTADSTDFVWPQLQNKRR